MRKFLVFYLFVLAVLPFAGCGSDGGGLGFADLAPVITLTGDNPQIIQLGDPYEELGATAIDDLDGDISAAIVIDSSAVDTNAVGEYVVYYNVIDSTGNEALPVERIVQVFDQDAPVITLLGANPQIIDFGTAYVELGATAIDDLDGDISAQISINASEVNTNAVGFYNVYYDVSDQSGNTALQTVRVVQVADLSAPVITLLGSNPQTIVLGMPYFELGVSAVDTLDGDLSGSVVIDSSAVDTGKVGTYYVYYNISDSAGNAATQVARNVVVVDQEVPIINLLGENPQTVAFGTAYNELGAVAFDSVDGDLSGSVVIDATAVDTGAIATYTVYYDVSDSAGNPATQVTRTVNVVDQTAPVISLVGSNPQIVQFGADYVELGATAVDNVDGDLSSSIVINADLVNTGSVDTYTVYYDVTDSAGNSASQVTRTVNVVDSESPVISLVGDNPQLIYLGGGYTELGATATDNVDGDISANIVIDSSAVNADAVGNYTVTYDVSDASGNSATQVVRDVSVEYVPLAVLGSQPTGLENPASSIIQVQFSENLDPASVTTSSVLVEDSPGSPVAGYSMTVSGSSLQIDPPSGVWPDGTLTVTLTTALKGGGGGSLQSDYVENIGIDSGLTASGFAVDSILPADLATDVVLDAEIVVTFNKAASFSTIVDGGIKLYDEARQVPGEWRISSDGLQATFTPDLVLATNVDAYNLEVTASVLSVEGEAIAPQTTIFKTIAPGVSWGEPTFGAAGSYNRVHAVAVDASGNVYVSGSTGTFAVRDAFVTKFGPDGAEQWTQQFDINGADDGFSVAVDRYGFVYLAGSTDTDGFIIRLPASGSLAPDDGYWQKVGFTSEPYEELFGVTTDWSGHVFAVGYAQDDFQSDPIVVKLRDTDGVVLGIDRIAATSGEFYETAISASYDPENDFIFICGDFEGAIGSVSSVDTDDAFVIRYQNDDSSLTFSRQEVVFLDGVSELPSVESGFTLATTLEGDVILGGYSTSKIDDDLLQTLDTNAPPMGYLISLQGDNLGWVNWSQDIADVSTDYTYMNGVAVDGLGNVYAAGSILDDFALDGADGSYAGERHGFVLQYNGGTVGFDYKTDYLKPSVATNGATGSDVEVTPAGDLIFAGVNEIDVASEETSGELVLRLYDDTLTNYTP